MAAAMSSLCAAATAHAPAPGCVFTGDRRFPCTGCSPASHAAHMIWCQPAVSGQHPQLHNVGSARAACCIVAARPARVGWVDGGNCVYKGCQQNGWLHFPLGRTIAVNHNFIA